MKIKKELEEAGNIAKEIKTLSECGMNNVIQKHLREKIEQMESYIESVPSSEIRIMMRYKYIAQYSWVKIAHKMNTLFPEKVYTAESCRKKVERFLKKTEECPKTSAKA